MVVVLAHGPPYGAQHGGHWPGDALTAQLAARAAHK
jgi:hypothetical protein